MLGLLAASVFVANILCSSALPFIKVEESNCGYQSCHPVKDGLINVHLVPHTHDDVGWLKTVDQYYYGANTNIQRAGVQYIIDTVIDALRRDSDRRFIYVETAFFWKWWEEQNDEIREITRTLVNNGQLEFIGGGWCMNDEAATHYHSIIDQMAWGLRRLNDTFGECGRPKIGWQIDPFGHSKGMAQVFSLLGYDAFLLNRIDYQEMSHRRETNTLEMIWRSSSSLGEQSDIFTSILPKHYSPPGGFCFDILCNDEPIIDGRSPDNNVDKRVDDFINFLDGITASGFTTNNVLITMGDDFTYQDATPWFKNIDKLIKYVNERQEDGSKYNVLYSTPSCYVKAVYDESKANEQTFPVKQDDFMPYASNKHSYWTGYYTSRPTLKRYEREGNNFLQICKQLSVLTGVDTDGLDDLRDAMGVMQHHDAVSGTEKQHVANDYARLISEGFGSCEKIVSSAFDQIVSQGHEDTFVNCPLLNISQCAFTETNDNFVVTLYNPLSRNISKVVRVPVTGDNYSVRNSQGQELYVQIQEINQALRNVPGRDSAAVNELIFNAANLPPLGYESFFVEKIDGVALVKPTKLAQPILRDVGFSVDPTTGLITNIISNDWEFPLSQTFAYYEGFNGTNVDEDARASGAYVFRPYHDSSSPVSPSATYQVYSGNVLAELHQVFNEWVSQVISVYAGENFVEFKWLVGPIPDDEDSEIGKEVISVFKTELNSDGIFYTDTNGREILKRVRDSRASYEIDINETVSANYYPVTSKILIRDEDQNLEFAVLNDRAQGGSSLNDGEVELMVHRRCLHDDAFGVGEALKENAFDENLVARGSHFAIVGPLTDSDGQTAAAFERDVAQRKLLDSWIFFSSTEDESFEEFSADHVLRYEGLTTSLPNNVQILTLEPWSDNSFLLRLEHVFEANEDATLSQTVTVDLNNLFASFEITSIEEATLGGNQLLEDNERLMFDEGEPIENYKNQNKIMKLKTVNESPAAKKTSVRDDVAGLQIDLEPMQIRTFVVNISRK